MKVIKKDGRRERFEDGKILTSCYEAFMNSHVPKDESYELAKKALRDIKKKIGKRKEIRTDEIFMICIDVLRRYNKDAAFMFETHRDIC